MKHKQELTEHNQRPQSLLFRPRPHLMLSFAGTDLVIHVFGDFSRKNRPSFLESSSFTRLNPRSGGHS